MSLARPAAGPSKCPHGREGEGPDVVSPAGTYEMYCSDLLNFLARYLADALLGILTKESSFP